MRFWDSSAIVPLVVEQDATARCRKLLAEDPAMVAWWGTPVECRSALARLRRENVLDEEQHDLAAGLVDAFRASWAEVLPSETVRNQALVLLRRHPLRAADALQLAAALTYTAAAAGSLFVTFDKRLRRAARLEGLTTV